MKRILLDTDMGSIATTPLRSASRLKPKTRGLPNSSELRQAPRDRRGGDRHAICRYYGKLKPVGVAARKIPCDDLNAYASACADKFGESDTAEPR
ncbi:MAG: hypothetical protein ACLUSP_05380 [Christensenellales bacterium]